jgi:uncharacterized protein (TIGR02421 family)
MALQTEPKRSDKPATQEQCGCFMDNNLPFAVVYLPDNNVDTALLKLLRSTASYCLIDREFSEKQQAELERKVKQMANRFGVFMLIEIFPYADTERRFSVEIAESEFPISLQKLQKSLLKFTEDSFDANYEIQVESIAEDKGGKGIFSPPFQSLQTQKIRVGIPAIFRNRQGDLFPIYFKQFRKAFLKALQKSMYEFIRLQTSAEELSSFQALGKRNLHNRVYEIDRELYEIQSSYQFLLLVAPTNLTTIREQFLNDANTEIDEFHYRLLPIDPDLLKRRLFDLRINEIDDPTTAFLLDEKREEIDQEVTMLKERGGKNFLYRSLRLYQGIDARTLEVALQIIEEHPQDVEVKAERNIDAETFAEIAREEFNYFQQQSAGFKSKVHIRDDVNILMVSQGELYIPAQIRFTAEECRAMVQHEIGTHVLTYYNGSCQPLKQMAIGLADYDALQEGIAVVAEYFADALTVNRLRILAGRVVAGHLLLNEKNFLSIYGTLHNEYGFNRERSFDITARMFQGGGFLKDIIYLRGLIQLVDFLKTGGELKKLLRGKYSLKQLTYVDELEARGIVKPPQVLPRYFENENFKDKLQALKGEIEISKIATK